MKTYEAIAALEALNKIAAGDAKTPLKFAYAAARNRRKLDEFVRTYEASRKALLNQYGKKKEDGELDIDDQGNVQLVDAQAFAKGMNDLHTEDLPDLKLHQVALENFPADIDLSVMEALLPMVLETEPVGASHSARGPQGKPRCSRKRPRTPTAG